jgi:hypothetical protein
MIKEYSLADRLANIERDINSIAQYIKKEDIHSSEVDDISDDDSNPIMVSSFILCFQVDGSNHTFLRDNLDSAIFIKVNINFNKFESSLTDILIKNHSNLQKLIIDYLKKCKTNVLYGAISIFNRNNNFNSIIKFNIDILIRNNIMSIAAADKILYNK